MLFRENERVQKLKENQIDLQGAIQNAGYDAQNMFPVMVQFKANVVLRVKENTAICLKFKMALK